MQQSAKTETQVNHATKNTNIRFKYHIYKHTCNKSHKPNMQHTLMQQANMQINNANTRNTKQHMYAAKHPKPKHTIIQTRMQSTKH